MTICLIYWHCKIPLIIMDSLIPEVAGECLHTLVGHSDRIHSLSFNPTQPTLASGSHDQTVKLWDLHTGKC